MFKALLTALAIALTGLLYADSTPDPAAWYRPLASDYQPPNEWLALMYLDNGRGELQQVEYTMVIDDQTGTVIESNLKESLSDLRLSLNTVVDILSETTIVAVENAWQIQKLDAQFTALGKNLTKVFQVDGMEIKVDDKVYRLKIPEGSLRNSITTGTSIRYDDIDGLFDDPEMDNKSIELKNDYIQIKGWDSEDGSKSIFDENNLGLVTRDEKGNLLYRSWFGIDKQSLGVNEDMRLEIKDWSTAKACGADLTKMLTDPADANRGQHLLLSKAGNALHYLPIGDVIQTNSAAVVVDEKSITKVTETSESGEESTKLALMGFKDAGGSKDSPAVPYSGDGENLMWQSFLTFFNPNMFESKNGKINLKGLDADANEVRILTVKAGEGGAAVTSDSMKTFIDPPLEWLNNKITVAGYNVADDNTYLKKTQTGVEWAKVDKGILADEKAVTTNAAPFEAFTLVGFKDAEENMIPFKDSTKLNWQKINDFLDTAIDKKSIALNSEEKLEVKGASSVNSPRKYFGSSTTSSLIGWWDLPNVTTNRVDVDEITLTTDNSADGKVKTIRWKSTPLSVPSLAKMGGNGIEWVPYDGVTNQNAIVGVDDISVATNGNGKLEIKGWSTQAACSADLIKMLTDVNDKDRVSHQLLCRVNNSIHYLPFDKVLDIPQVDGDTIVWKGDGTFGLAGSYGVDEGTVPHRTANGLEWKKPNGDIEVDEPLIKEEGTDGSTKIKLDEDYLEELKCKCEPHTRPIADGYTIIEKEDGIWSVSEDFVGSEAMTNAIDEAINEAVSKPDGLTIIENEDDGYFSLVGSYEAEPNTMLVKDEDGNYVWLPIDQFKNDINIDGDTIVWKSDETIGLAGSYNAAPGSVPTRSDSGLTWIAPQTMEVLTDIEWDDSTKTFKKTYKTIEFYGKVVETE